MANLPVKLPPPFEVDPNVPSQAVVFDLTNQCFLPLQVFWWDNITTAGTVTTNTVIDWSNWTPTTYFWTQVPYTSWSTITSDRDSAMYIGTESGYIMEFFNSPTDNLRPVGYTAIWALRSAPALTQNFKVSWIECYLQQIPSGPTNYSLQFNEAIEADLIGYIQPLDATPVPYTALAIALADQTTFSAPVEPGPTNPRNLPVNWIQFKIQGVGNPTSGNFAFAGATLYTDLDDKPDYQSVGGMATR